MTKTKFLLTFFLLLVCSITWAQNEITVKGIVTDKNSGELLAGVTIYNTQNLAGGTLTDVKGNYSISVKPNATLKFTYIGYTAVEIQVENRTNINVQMEQAIEELEEVIVVGLSMRKADLTGAVERISSNKLVAIPAGNINEALQGRVAGVYVQNSPTPGGSASIQIRGNNSISYGTDPIYVVDGIVMSGGFNAVNLNDVATVDVLKDASATSLYGSRGANGVVVITTKKGAKGGKVSYDGWLGWEGFSNTLPKMNAQQTYDLRVDAYVNKFMEDFPNADRQAYIQSITTPGSPDAVFDQYEFDAIAQGKSYDWLDNVVDKGFQQSHSINFSGGGDKGNYYMSFGYTSQDGLVKNSDYTRYTGRINLDQNIKSWLKIGTNTSYTRTIQNSVDGSVFGNAFSASPFYEPNDVDIYMKWGAEEQNGVNNPIKSLTVSNDQFQNRLNMANYININPIEGLNFRATYSVALSDQESYTYNPKNTGQSIRNSLDGEAVQSKNESLNWQWDISAAYNKTFANKHRVSAMTAFNASKNNSQSNSISARGFASDDFTYKYINGSFNKDINEYSSNFSISSIVAFVERFNYSYALKYFATLTVREEASSKMAPGNRWGTFPSLALSWVISEENFLKSSGIFDQLKLRAGYGIVGNQNIPANAYYSLYRPSVSGSTVTYNSDGRLGNPDIRWEQQKQLNLGLDVSVLKNRLSFTTDYFYINNDDLLMQRSLSSLTGFTNTISNVGAMTNRGFEFTVNAKILDNSDFKWDLNGNISFSKNKVTKLYGNVDVLWNMGGANNIDIQRTGNLFLGQSINTIYVWKFDKIVQQEDMERVSNMNLGGRIVKPGDIIPVDVDDNGVIDDKDRYVVGTTDPKFFGGFSTEMKYKGIGLNAIFNYTYGKNRLSGRYEGMMNSNGRSVAHQDLMDRWTPENTNTIVPRAYSEGGRYSFGDVDWGVQDASFLRLSTLTISYDLPSQIINFIKVSHAQVYFTGNNMFLVTPYKGYDPEGGDSYPTSRMYVTGLRFDF